MGASSQGATVRHAIYGGQWRWLHFNRLGRKGPFSSLWVRARFCEAYPNSITG